MPKTNEPTRALTKVDLVYRAIFSGLTSFKDIRIAADLSDKHLPAILNTLINRGCVRKSGTPTKYVYTLGETPYSTLRARYADKRPRTKRQPPPPPIRRVSSVFDLGRM